MKARHVLFMGILMWMGGGLLAEHRSAVSRTDIMMRLRGGAPEAAAKTKKPAAKPNGAKKGAKATKKGAVTKPKASTKPEKLTPKDFDNPEHWDRLLPDGPKPFYNLERPIFTQLRKTVMNMSKTALGVNSTEAEKGKWVNEVRYASKILKQCDDDPYKT